MLPHFKYSVVTCGSWELFWTLSRQNVSIIMESSVGHGRKGFPPVSGCTISWSDFYIFLMLVLGVIIWGRSRQCGVGGAHLQNSQPVFWARVELA